MKKMHAWDGREGGGGFTYDVIASGFCFWIDEGGTVYYAPRTDPEGVVIWCPADRLRRHLHHLAQIHAR